MTKADILQLPDTEEVICTAKNLKDLVREVEEEIKADIWGELWARTDEEGCIKKIYGVEVWEIIYGKE